MTMKTALCKGWKWLLGALLGVLGFSGCEIIGESTCEYGQPYASFKLIGDVKDAGGRGIEGIRVVVNPVSNEEETWENDTLYSDSKGHFEKDQLKHDWPDQMKNATVKFEDVDGSEHGSFKTKVLTSSDLEIKQVAISEGSWYHGAYTVRADAVLEEDN